MNNKEFIIGKLKEDDFSSLFNDVEKASKEDDMYSHWDLKINAKIDIKSIRKQSRSDVLYDENFHWVEILNVNGSKGSLYGEADFFAFETKDYWVIVDKDKLKEFIESRCKGKKIGKSKDPYELYRRENRKDVVVKVKTIDLIYISTKLLKKENDTQQQ